MEINTGPARPPRSASEPVDGAGAGAGDGETWAQAVAAHGSTGSAATAGAPAAVADGDGDDEYDPLDAFMQDIDTKVKTELAQQPKAAAAPPGTGAGGNKKSKVDLECDEEYDAAEYMLVGYLGEDCCRDTPLPAGSSSNGLLAQPSGWAVLQLLPSLR